MGLSFDFPILSQTDLTPLGLHGCSGCLRKQGRGRPEGKIGWERGNTDVCLQSLGYGNFYLVLRFEISLQQGGKPRQWPQGANLWCGSAAGAVAPRAGRAAIHLVIPQHEQCMRRSGLLLFAVVCMPYMHS